MTRILIADDHHVVRSGLRTVLEAQPGFEVVGEAANGMEAVEAALRAKPDVVVLDYSMPVRNGVEATREIRARLPRTEVLIFTMHDSQDVIEDILSAGARGYLLKADANDHLIAAVQALGRHEAYISGKLSAGLLDTLLAKRKRQRRGPLTPRERSVVQLIAEGNTNKAICAKLGVTVKTIETHRAAAMRKLDLHTTADIVRYAVKNRMVEI
ncbi:response regulator [Microvirga aerophila]|uniref:DNA-binding response regulator n=1 Tax=Microvirga aerophila TaxID=670291 RepID=A0A512C055_9HYPH|nr:response regulator transcription factor [Microvirga aerophila]GEO17595.1 DNA-binding response regulator [Microvirga aerophila]